MTRTEIIQLLIDKYNYKTYLEIGYQNGVNFNAIKCDHKISVDPDKSTKAIYHSTSDQYFEDKKKGFVLKSDPETYDCIFVDGLHENEQVYRDIKNSLDILNEGGTIVCHDMNPTSEYMQTVPRPNTVGKPWNGDCWKALVRAQRDFEIQVHTVDSDYGCAVIQKSTWVNKTCEHLLDEDLTYVNLDAFRKTWLNLITPYKFQQIFKK